jgi:TolB protein
LILVLVYAGSAASAATAGTGPDDALVPSDGWRQLGAVQEVWYTFQYAGDGSQIVVRLEALPQEGVTFAVWTPGGIRRWGLGLEADPIGRGSSDPSAGNALLWTGNFTEGGTYYVVVEHAGSQAGPRFYQLEVTGAGVSLAAQPAATEAALAAAKPAKAKAPAAPQGKLVFQTTVGGPFYRINVDGSGLERVTDGLDATWSPSGKQIAFVRWREPRGVWVLDVEQGVEWRVFDWSETRWPSWSPDGGSILFSHQKGGRLEDVERCFWGFCFTFAAHPKWRLGVVDVDGSDYREPASPQYSLAPMWSPVEAERLVLSDENGLRVQSPDGTVSYLITGDARDTSPAWSPDGGRVAFNRRQHDHWEIYVVDADGRNVRRLTETPRKPNGEVGHSAAPAWSPDGEYLAFLTDRRGVWEIWVMRANGGDQKPMFKDALKGLTIDYGSVAERAISWTE